jgi:hypothetical protein
LPHITPCAHQGEQNTVLSSKAKKNLVGFFGTFLGAGRDMKQPKKPFTSNELELISEYWMKTTQLHCMKIHRPVSKLQKARAWCLAERTKHFDIKYHWLREKIKKMDVKLSYINTHDQLADIFTKPLGFIQHNLLKNRMTGYDVWLFVRLGVLE